MRNVDKREEVEEEQEKGSKLLKIIYFKKIKYTTVMCVLAVDTALPHRVFSLFSNRITILEKEMSGVKLVEFNSEDSFVNDSVSFIHSIINDAIKSRGAAVIGLSGGTSPKPIYNALVASNDIDWNKVYFFCVDERYITKTSADSLNHLVANSIFREGLPTHKLLNDGIHFTCPNTSLPLDLCIAKYHADLEHLLKKSGGAADLVTLGMGEDGHIASIFPVTDENEPPAPISLVYHTTTTRFVVFDRITTNLRFLEKSRAKLFFMKGESKKVVWDEMLAAPENIRRWPAQGIIKSGHTYVHYLK
ncbi:6-phosphogluconolactonase [Heterostelium album PN500]|uniref:6-phosphogluconolactonase n=1 Tax=Heterostelium pallidum (strain ATCC 26659 / Pp 5 / PN500) TaxID=670386 RepID=D3B1N1_HETP5|nr:6-phosphogluconolactonase [Heterostelium album PN500]EFA85205.1 6-phosphogluconolactonase [Heterostelium album PN500]|eukprot:XP_020437314.1 6-phosphogluconolactonase [Heterostelium album PN500]